MLRDENLRLDVADNGDDAAADDDDEDELADEDAYVDDEDEYDVGVDDGHRQCLVPNGVWL